MLIIARSAAVLAATVSMTAMAAAQPAADVPAIAETAQPTVGGSSLVAIWYNGEDPAASRILATYEDGALVAFGLDGAILQTIEGDEPVGIDIRYGIDIGGARTDIAVLGDGQTGAVSFFAIAADGVLSPLGEPVTPSVHGTIACLYESSLTGVLNLFAMDGDGLVGQYEVTFDDGPVLEELRVFDVGGGTSICVADDVEGAVYIGEEATGLWSYAAEPDASRDRVLVDAILPVDTRIQEVEGAALVAAASGQDGYLLAADEAGQTIHVYDRATYAYLGGFTVGEGAVDAVDDPHGVAALAMPLGELYPNGLVVVQDDAEDEGNPSFKLVSLGDVVDALGLPVIEEPRDPRTDVPPAAAVLPVAETQPVGSRGDAADDPAIWVNPEDPEATLIVGTDKQAGLGVYNLDGELLNFVEIGQINNVDIRTVTVSGADHVIVAATNRVDQTIAVLELFPDGTLTDIVAAPIQVQGGEAYGFCLYKDADGALFGLANTTSASSPASPSPSPRMAPSPARRPRPGRSKPSPRAASSTMRPANSSSARRTAASGCSTSPPRTRPPAR